MRLTWNAALEETEMVLFESVHKLFKATGVSAQEVSHLAAVPLPSLSPALCTAQRGTQQHAQATLQDRHTEMLVSVRSLQDLGYFVLSHSALT